MADAVAALGGLDVLVLAHGVGGSALAGEETPEGWDAVVRVNLTGAFLVARAALPHLVERRGAIVTVASTNAWVAGPGWASYCASKAGLAMLTASIANDYGPRGVRANCVCPGWVRTPMADDDMDEIAARWGTDRDGAYRLTTSSTPLRRPAEPAEIAAVVAFLAGPGASYVNGASIPVDGGAMIVDGTSVPFHRTGAPPRATRLLDSVLCVTDNPRHREGLLRDGHSRVRDVLAQVPELRHALRGRRDDPRRRHDREGARPGRP